MAARALQPSEYEIQREVEALRDIRRRSTTPGALTIDPDLPNQSPPSSPTTTYWSGKARSPPVTDSKANGASQESGSSNESSESDHTNEATTPNNPADDPFHLFWVPASLHPEIAPAEFRAFLKEHARNPPSDGGDGSLERASSLASRSSLTRKRSMLSRQYQPKEGDESDGDEKIVPLRRNRSYAQHVIPQLTISDLQKLEELAEEASQSDDPSKLRSVLRRSLSLNLSPTAIGQMDVMPEMADEADVPIIVPPPGQILRRAARTKIRKPGLPGEGAAHRFGSSRRGRRSSGEGRTSVEQLSNEGSEPEASTSRRQTISDDGSHNRPDSFSEEASIFDAYVRDDEEEVPPPVPALPPHVLAEPSPIPPPPVEEAPQLAQPEIQPSLLEALGPILDSEQPQVAQPVPIQPLQEPPVPQPSRTPSPEPVVQETPAPIPQTYSPQPFQPAPPSAIIQPITSIQQQLNASISAPVPQQPPKKEKEKDKKGLFGKWGSDKSGKKNKGEKEKEKESFFGSLFGSKKKQEDSSSSVNTAGREAAQALLGASKSSKNYVPPSSPGLAPGINNYSRYPIHVERAIYRLSHIKLANPRRPLYEQVLISNLMFWYLGVINKAQNPQPQSTPDSSASQAEKEQREKEQQEKELREKAEKERLERERLEKEQKERELEMKKKESGRRGSLTKTPPGGSAGGRRAEMPVKGPQYDVQQQVMQKEYSNGYNGPRNPNQPGMMNGPNSQPYPRGSPSMQPQQFPPQPYPPQATPQYPTQQGQPYPPQQYPNSPPRNGQPQMKGQGPDHYYYDNGGARGGLPPGAMPPVNMAPGPAPGPHQPQRSPQMNSLPQQQSPSGPTGSPGRAPTRSLSANAVPSGGPPLNGHTTLRKGNSAHAVAPYERRRTSEEDDTPLAVYQQQRR
ncbi:hypothetical protein CC1G_00944 [Coprinopsis cinerea okayama7|uniref:Protein Zds1 C-terminal domain-containing protein n=1 Tax=Coprinopsis cinerea (strain Okayama-7 / 130 / ATCC MYA-4618 / FGSC 9003) TaxID=240176 RepID=A8N969_COPC7|nr:hypothetical protein CC1G_00944 [Coprinopsis cinerea okayama7\|eukprot:XP_001831397.2 hypothetical protein CC1G_00944 [Coprinopsis cinerea okayama7\